ncbi:MAG: lipopolysaccharide core heptose(I) kinase RfaP [Lentisphaeria bacterium]|nr:lipopolysaccharide core heptose(I) kinase RfaP [Lentisphaeria bacterium]
MREVFLNEIFQRMWKDLNPFQAAFELTGESFRKVKSRHTFRVEIEGRGYFVKLHRGIGWTEYFKNLLQFKSPVTDAGQEYRALLHLKAHGVDSMTPAAYGCEGLISPLRSSFLITDELKDCVSLEDFCRDWSLKPPPFQLKRALIRKLGQMAGKMHRSGLNHRDCYICHFLLRKGSECSADPELHVIDLHRAQIRKKVPWHYWVKDVAGLWFSAMDAGLTRHDILYFLRTYFQQDLQVVFRQNGGFLKAVDAAARRLYRKDRHKEPPAGIIR